MSSTCSHCGQIVPYGHNHESPFMYSFQSEDEIFEHMDFLIKTYACAKNDKLTADAIDLKRKVLKHLRHWAHIYGDSDDDYS